MSFTFQIAARTPPDYQTIMEGLGYWDVRCAEDDPEEPGPWPETIRHYYRDEVSTRGVEVALREGQFSVRVLTLASADDYELALRFVESAAVLLKQPVVPEDGDPFPVAELRDRYPESWARQLNENGAHVVRSMIEQGAGVITMSGSQRPCHIGPRLLAELQAAGPAGEFLDRLLGKMLDVQNIDATEYYAANGMEAKRKDDDGKGFSFAVWDPALATLLPDVEFVAIVESEDAPPIFLRRDSLADVALDGISWLDERQMLVEAVDEFERDDLFVRARAFEVSPFEEE